MKTITFKNWIKIIFFITILGFLLDAPKAKALIPEIVTGALWENTDNKVYTIEVRMSPIEIPGNLASEALYGTHNKGLPVLNLPVRATEALANDFVAYIPPFDHGERDKYGLSPEWQYSFPIPKTHFYTATGPGGGTADQEPEYGDPGAVRGNIENKDGKVIFKPGAYAELRQHPIALIYALVPLGDDPRFTVANNYGKKDKTGMGDVKYDRQKDSVETKEYGHLKANMSYGADRPAFEDYWRVVNGELAADGQVGMPFKITTEKIHFTLNYPADNVFDSFVDFVGAVFGDEDPEYILRFVVSGRVGFSDNSTSFVTLKGGTVVSKLSFENGKLGKEHFIGQFGPPELGKYQVNMVGTLVSYGKTDLEYDSKKLPNIPTQYVSKLGDTNAIIFNPTHLPDVKDKKMEPVSPTAVFHIRN